MEPAARHGIDRALSAVYEALAPAGRPADAWRRFAARLTLAAGDDGLVLRASVEEAARSIRPGLAAAQLVTAAERLGVLAGKGERLAYAPSAAEDIARALALAGHSLAAESSPASWVPVGTIPEVLRRKVVVPELRQTAGILLEIIDHARRDIWLTAPFVERGGVDFLTEALLGALERGVSVHFVTRPGVLEGAALSGLLPEAAEVKPGAFKVFEVATDVSDLGSHAKVCLADDQICYIGSANLTTYGLGRHLELGARLHGPDVAVIRAALEAIADLGRLAHPHGDKERQ